MNEHTFLKFLFLKNSGLDILKCISIWKCKTIEVFLHKTKIKVILGLGAGKAKNDPFSTPVVSAVFD